MADSRLAPTGRTNGTTRRVSPFAEIGSTGLRQWSGHIYEEFLRDWRPERRTHTILEMVSNDPVMGAVKFAVEMLIRQVKWPWTPASEDTESERGKQFAEENFNDMSMTWADTLCEILTFLDYGWEASEIVWKRRLGMQQGRRDASTGQPLASSRYADGKIAIRKLAPRAQNTLDGWKFDEHRGIQGLWQSDPYDRTKTKVFIPIERLLVFRTSARKGSPEGVSIYRPAYVPYYYKKKVQEAQMIGVVRDLQGLPIAYVPPEIMASDAPQELKDIYNEVKKIANNVHVDEQSSIVFPNVFDEHGNKLYEFQLLSASGQKQFDTKAIMEYYDHRIVASVLASVILMGQDKVGSFALADNNTELFAVALGSWCDSICDVINRHLVPRLWALNGMPFETMPILTHGDIERVNLTELGNFILNMAKAGMPVDDLTNDVRRMGNLREIPEEELAAIREDERRASARAARRDAEQSTPEVAEKEEDSEEAA